MRHTEGSGLFRFGGLAQNRRVPVPPPVATLRQGEQRYRTIGTSAMNLIILVVILLIVFGGGGFYYGGPYVGGGLGTVLLIILIVLLLRG